MADREKVIQHFSDCRDIATANNNGWVFVHADMLADALALLKAQEPRVLTLEDALNADECWLERKDGNVTVASIALNGEDKGSYDIDSFELGTLIIHIFHSGYYGKYWRCWSSRPTDEQRKKVKWDG